MDFWFRLPTRTKLGIISTVLLAIAGIAIVCTFQDPNHRVVLGSIIKLAPILFLFWLAWTDLKSLPYWVYWVAPPVMIFCAIKPRALFVVVPIALIALFVRPKRKRKK